MTTERFRLATLGTCLVLIAFNLRTVFSSLAAVLEEVRATTEIPDALIALLTTAPVALLGIFAPLAPMIARRIGLERALWLGMALLVFGLGIRGVGAGKLSHIIMLFLGTIAAAIAIAVGNVLLPSLIKRDFPHLQGLMSGLYTMAMCGSAALAAGLTYPLFHLAGTWEFALSSWAIFAVVILGLFTPFALRPRPVEITHSTLRVNVWRHPTAWWVATFMTSQAMSSFSVFVWLAPILRSRGISPGTAGAIAAGSIVVQIIGSLCAPGLAMRLKDQRALNAVLALGTGFSFALCILGPVSLLGLSAILLGLFQGSLTATALALIILRTTEPETAGQLSGMVQGVGYGVGALGTFLVGQLYAATGGFGIAALMFCVIGIIGAFLGLKAGANTTVHAELGDAEYLEVDTSTPLPESTADIR